MIRYKIVLQSLNPLEITPKEALGLIFINENDVMSILTNLEDVIKSAQWFGNKPYHTHIIDTYVDVGNNDQVWLGNGSGVLKMTDKDMIDYLDSLPNSTHKIVASTNKSLGVINIESDFLKYYKRNDGIIDFWIGDGKINILYKNNQTEAEALAVDYAIDKHDDSMNDDIRNYRDDTSNDFIAGWNKKPSLKLRKIDPNNLPTEEVFAVMNKKILRGKITIEEKHGTSPYIEHIVNVYQEDWAYPTHYILVSDILGLERE